MGKPKLYIDGQAGTTGLQIYDRLAGRRDVEFLTIAPERRKDPGARRALMAAADLVFFCLPDEAAAEAAVLCDGLDTRIIDASTAHRTAPGWVYGFPELHGRREEVKGAKRVANPGCYATGAISLLRPLTEAGILKPDYPVDLHALSGYTGGGAKTVDQYEDPERDAALDSPRHYALGLSHKHLPEITAQSGLTRTPTFCPIICDFPQGMTVALPLHLDLVGTTVEGLRQCYRDYYAGEKLVTVSDEAPPSFLPSNALAGKDTLTLYVGGNGDRAVCLAQLDNLGKGASGAAVQNMNLMLGFDETTGLMVE